ATGARLWVSRYNGPGNGEDVTNAVGVDPGSSEVFVTGWSVGVGYDYATVGYDAATGARLWVSRYNGPQNLNDLAYALGVSPDGSKVFVTGGSFASDQGGD